MNHTSQNIISISADFLKAFADIPQAQQKKVREFVQQFQNNPEMPGGRHYEQIQKIRDSNLRSIRIDQIYRAIIAKPSGNIFILLWVDKHEEAYQWAERKKLKIHPCTGGLQLIQIQHQNKVIHVSKERNGLFDKFSEQQLLSLGVPEELVQETRGIQTEDDLVDKEPMFPLEAYNSLFMLACGERYEDVLSEYSHTNQQNIDISDFEKALKNDDTQSRFKIIENGVELETLLNSPLDQWRVFLHPLQRKIVETNASGPMRVLGCAGTGKTVVAMHRAKFLSEKVFTNKDDRILFTTFTKNLAADIFCGLQQICSPDLLKRIEVINLDAWTHHYMEKMNYHFNIIDYDPKHQDELWEQALVLKPNDLQLSDQFYRDEWEQVIQAQNIVSMEGYLRASRVGRGRRINLLERKKLWPVWEEYRALLNEGNFCEIQDLYRDAAVLLSKMSHPQYRSVIVDEAQDFSNQAYQLIRAILPEGRNDIFIVGDAHQRIYGRQASLGKNGIKITGRSKKLKVNYRTTAQTYHFASSVLTGLDFDDLDGQEDILGKCQSVTTGPKPSVFVFHSIEEEQQKILSLINNLHSSNVSFGSICLTCRSNDLLEKYMCFLEKQNIPCHKISSSSSLDARDRLQIATMHRVKGIEFDYMIIASACDKIIPPNHILDAQENNVDRQNVFQRERSLLYVALTRARKEVFLTGYGKLSGIIPSQQLEI